MNRLAAATLFSLLAGLSHANAAELRLGGMQLSDRLDGPAKAVFTPDAPKIVLSVGLSDLPTGSKVSGTWIAEKAEGLSPDFRLGSVEYVVQPPTARLNLSMNKPETGWPVGDYRLELAVAGKPAGVMHFKVARS